MRCGNEIPTEHYDQLHQKIGYNEAQTCISKDKYKLPDKFKLISHINMNIGYKSMY